MSYQVLARKWRPRNFEQVIGQRHVIRALENALKMGRLHHAYLFTGTRGVGKTTIARILAKCFNCEQGVGAAPCGECAACRQVDAGNFIDLIEVDAASRTGVDDMRELLDNVQYASGAGRFKIYLIDEVHMLSVNSFNALLKTLEEPPEHVKFFFATTHPRKIPVTILSRCLQFNLTRLPHRLIHEHLAALLDAENITHDDGALGEIAVAAEGSVRDALSLLDQAIAYGDGQLKSNEVEAMLGLAARQQIADMGRCIAARDTEKLFELIELAYRKAVDFETLLKDIIALLHQVALRQALPGAAISPQLKERDVDELAAAVAPEDLQLCYQIALNGKRDMAFAPDDKAAFEMTMLRMMHFTPLQTDSAPQGGAQPQRPPQTQPQNKAAAQAQTQDAPASQAQRAAAAQTPAQDTPPQAQRPPVPRAPAQSKAAAQAPAQDATAPQAPTPPAADAAADGAAAAAATATANAANAANAATAANAPQGGFQLADCGDAQGWVRLIEAAGFEGPLREICFNSLLTPQSQTEATLAVDARIEGLCTPPRQEEIRRALSRLIGAEAVLRFETAASDETPAQARKRRELERRRKAALSIEKNPQVHSLKERFNAQTIPDSTQPVESDG
ncbi:MAG: DNA polymerase III subunit gamma/tau [Gammaproteobacteria bacterium]|nr:DNA polymerase III subunit gamma/tau [Gammaproteobacteria bacterium]